ncbi:MAG: hypothetical protein AAFO84_04745 [Cyanobacteria bacterium J06598_1]
MSVGAEQGPTTRKRHIEHFQQATRSLESTKRQIFSGISGSVANGCSIFLNSTITAR